MRNLIFKMMMVCVFALNLNATTQDDVIELYIATFDRAPDSAGLDYWVGRIDSDEMTIETVASSFFDQPETKEKYPENSTSTEVVDLVYQNILGRVGDEAGRAYWIGELDSGKISRANIIIALINGAKAGGTTDDKALLENKKEVGKYFAIDILADDVTTAKSIMTGITADASTVTTAKSTLNSSLLSTGKIVDPYIEGAILCEDVDKDKVCATTEQVSSASDAEGNFSFTKVLRAGSNVIIKEQGKHEGETFDIDIAGVVNSSGQIPVVSPLTTFEARGLTSTQIASMLESAGLSGFDTSTILNDPMSGGLKDKTVSSITEADLLNLQASIATYGLIKVMNGSTTLQGLANEELLSSTQANGEVNQILSNMITIIQGALNTTTLSGVKTAVDSMTAPLSANPFTASLVSDIPEPTMDVVIKTAVVVMDRLSTIGYTTCNATQGTPQEKVTAALAEVSANKDTILSQVSSLGETFYSNINKDKLSALTSFLPTDMATGASATGSSFRFDENNILSQIP